MNIYEKEEEQGLWKKKIEPKKKERSLKRPAKEREATGRRDPRKRELTNYRRTFK